MIRLSFWREGEKQQRRGKGVGGVFPPFYSAKFSPKEGLDIQRRINDLKRWNGVDEKKFSEGGKSTLPMKKTCSV